VIPTISLEELRAKIERKDDFALVEALPGVKYRRGHLPGAINLPFFSVSRLASKRLPNKNQEIVVYCGAYT
jgi:rhodanese-related sulfurtransferase